MAYRDLMVQNSIPLYINNVVGDLIIASTTNATSTSTGALQVRGGIAISNDLFVGDDLQCKSLVSIASENSTSPLTGSVTLVGGMGIAKDLFIGGKLNTALASAPVTTSQGDVYFNTTTKKLMLYDGSSWVALN